MDILSPKDKAEFRTALAALLERPGLTPEETDLHVDTLIRYCQRRGLALTHCLVGREGGRLVTACLCVDGAGRMSSVFIPTQARFLVPATATARLLNELASQAGERNVLFLQGTVSPDAAADAEVYRAAGFARLTQLIYMDSEVTQWAMPPAGGPRLEWTTYEPHAHSLFASVIQGTYKKSLDCVALNGARDIDDVLASHRSAGEFDPRLWFIAGIGGQPVGVILLSPVPERWAVEVVYMGVLPAWRGQGCGAALMRRAVETVFRQGLTTLTLTVDAGNAPALKLYSRFGLRETTRRDVWLRRL